MDNELIPAGNEANNFYNDWTIVFKSGAVLELEKVALVRHIKSDGSLGKIVVTRKVPMGAEAAINGKGDYALDLEEISGAFLANA